MAKTTVHKVLFFGVYGQPKIKRIGWKSILGSRTPTDGFRMARVHPGHTGPPSCDNVIPELVWNRVKESIPVLLHNTSILSTLLVSILAQQKSFSEVYQHQKWTIGQTFCFQKNIQILYELLFENYLNIPCNFEKLYKENLLIEFTYMCGISNWMMFSWPLLSARSIAVS